MDETSPAWERGGPLAHPARDERTAGPLATAGCRRPAAIGLGLLFWRRADGGNGGGGRGGVPGPPCWRRWWPGCPPRAPDSGGRGRATGPATTRPDGWSTSGAAYQPAVRARSRWLSQTLRPPLGGWRLAYLGPAPAPAARTLGLAAGLAALAAVIVGAGVWLYRDSTRELRLAAQRVSFVNQVSHELKTPLTNVRLHAELLEDHMEASDPEGRRRLGIVIAESQRLGRLITNILTFASAEKGKLRLHPTPASVDEVVTDVLAQFAPGLEAQGVRARLVPGAPGRVQLDADALSQMLGNLLGNVEKYAAGGEVVVATQAEGSRITVTVQDSGPGIPRPDWQRIFRPFVRLGGAAHEGVPGTGIGLGLARDLARLHGGDLQVIPSARGACFQLTLTAEPLP